MMDDLCEKIRKYIAEIIEVMFKLLLTISLLSYMQRRRNREGNGGARPAMLKSRGRNYLFVPAII